MVRLEDGTPPCDVVNDGHVPHWTMSARVMAMVALE